MTIAEFVNKVGFVVDQKSVQNTENTIRKVSSTAKRLLSVVGISLSLASINQIIEEFTAVNTSIKSAVGSSENLEQVQKRILDSANEARVSYSLMANTVSNLVKANKDLFNPEEAAEFSENIAKLMKSAGRSNDVIATMMEGFNKSFQKGVVDTETLNIMLERAPEAANLLAEKLNVSKTALISMASAGTLKVQDLKNVFIESSEEIDKAFASVPLSVSDAMQIIKNKWGNWLADTNKNLKATETIAEFMVAAFDKLLVILDKVAMGVQWLSDLLGGFDNLLSAVAIGAGLLYVAFNFNKIVGGFKIVMSFLSKINLKTIAITGAFLLLILLIEDFIVYLNGGKSVLGTILDGSFKDQFSKKFLDAGQKIVDGFTRGFELIDDAFGTHLSNWYEDYCDWAFKIGQKIYDFEEDFWDPMWKACYDTWFSWGVKLEQGMSFLVDTWKSYWQDMKELGAEQYAMTHQEELEKARLDGLYNGLDNDIILKSNEYMRRGMSAEEAFAKAKDEILTDMDMIAYFNTYLSNDVNLDVIESNRKTLEETGQIKPSAYSGVNSQYAKELGYYASGTDYSKRDFIAGEKGPELVTNQKGRKVYDALATADIFRNLNALSSIAHVRPSTVSSSSINNSRSTSIVQNVEINNEFNGDRAIQREASSAMNSSASSITSELARGLSFAR